MSVLSPLAHSNNNPPHLAKNIIDKLAINQQTSNVSASLPITPTSIDTPTLERNEANHYHLLHNNNNNNNNNSNNNSSATTAKPKFQSLPISPQPSRPTSQLIGSPRSVFAEELAQLQNYFECKHAPSFEDDEELDESESIISEAFSIMTPDFTTTSRNNNYTDNGGNIIQPYWPLQQQRQQQQSQQQLFSSSSTVVTASFLSDVKQTLPSITSTDSPSTILTSFFSNQLFYAQNLTQLPQHFINQEFDSFDHDVVLNPHIPSSKHHAKIIEQLDQLYVSSIELVSVITMFNCFIAKINHHEVGLQYLESIKSQYDNLINDYLCQHVHLILDKIIDGLYEYNLMIEEMLEEDERSAKDEANDHDTKEDAATAAYDTINDYYNEIETTLTLSNSKLSQQDCEKFHNLLNNEIIHDKHWNDYITHLRKFID
ncbi:hypothetical protein CANMA_001116 [Candida margitis]|uniref:uncharacterized protein n=1 Tax=Candida margitis TaxID=1775924 RepID=UPI00222720CF|nr:uncharacterized protein CANMA_001116 [Candida margitis]KAI5969826.1 hypothetical protein CANMA_001116 [Candida margitis]